MPKLTASAKKCSFVIIWAKHVKFSKIGLNGGNFAFIPHNC